jgi:hypothetical protein
MYAFLVSFIPSIGPTHLAYLISLLVLYSLIIIINDKNLSKFILIISFNLLNEYKCLFTLLLWCEGAGIAQSV